MRQNMKKVLVITLLIIFILVFIVLISIIMVNVKINRNNSTKNKNVIAENTNVEDANINLNEINRNEIGSDSPLFAYVEKEIVDPNLINKDEMIRNIKISIANVNTETLEYIKDRDGFVFAIKKYMYEKGLIDESLITMTSSRIQNNKIIMYFVMNNKNKTKLEIIYNILDNTTSITELITNE